MKKILTCLLVITLLFSGCNLATPKFEGTQIKLSDNKITVDGKTITNDNTQAVYSANDIVFYLAGQDFTYGEGAKEDEHEQSEADTHTVVHITKPGRYILSGKLSLGQIAVDLGEDAETDPNAVVTLILNGVDITCTVAPAVIFYNVYECGVADEETATKDVDTKNAGANVIVADGTQNNIDGSYVAKIYKSYELNEDGTEVIDSKKLHKYDAAFYSKKTMNINGGEKGDGIDSNGWLVINGGTVIAQACATSGDAGIDSDLGIYINGGNVIASGNMLDRIAGGEQTYVVFNFASRQVGDSTYTLKNAENKVVGEYAPTNDFIYLLIAGDELVEGDYTFWQGDTQLSASSMNMGGMNKDEIPEGQTNANGTPPEIPDGMENMQRPQRDENMTMPNGEAPELPEGMENMTPPNKIGGGMGMMGGFAEKGETTTTFTIVKGVNQFSNVSPIAATVSE